MSDSNPTASTPASGSKQDSSINKKEQTVETSIPLTQESNDESSNESSLTVLKSPKPFVHSETTDIQDVSSTSSSSSSQDDDAAGTDKNVDSALTSSPTYCGLSHRWAICVCIGVIILGAVSLAVSIGVGLGTSNKASSSPSNTGDSPTDNNNEDSPNSSPSPATVKYLVLVGDNGKPEASFPLDRCEGDCDFDSQCRPGLKCFQRHGNEPVPGCSGPGEAGKDYCYQELRNHEEKPQEPPPRRDPPLLVMAGNSGKPAAAFPLGLCEGDCDSDEECQPGLECIKVDENGHVPGCRGYEIDKRDYCYNPNTYVEVLNTTDYLLGLCEGDCQNNDTKCESGLKCFHREEGDEKVPGCRGSGLLGNDYCYQVVSSSPTQSPAPTEALQAEGITYKPGELTGLEAGLILSTGLTARIIAQSQKRVLYHNGNYSSILFHGRPDFGATFVDTSGNNPGGWIYVSNSEMEKERKGGVGAITFDCDGNVISYKMILTNTTMNCGGGRTPWNTWVSCEEVGRYGQIYQTDPLGNREGQPITMGLDGDRFESFTYDDRDATMPVFFTTTDTPSGALRRWTPDYPDMVDPWDILHGPGKLQYLHMIPEGPDGKPPLDLQDVDNDKINTTSSVNTTSSANTTSSVNNTSSANTTAPDVFLLGACEGDCDSDSDCRAGLKCFDRKKDEIVPGCTGEGTMGKDYCYDSYWENHTSSGKFIWIDDYEKAKQNAKENFPETEGIDCVGGVLYFVSKPRKVLNILDLDAMTFRRESTVHGVFEGAADQIQRILADDDGDEILYFTEERDGGTNAGIHGRNRQGQFLTILEGDRALYESESSGLAFSPDGCHLYFAFQKTGVLFDVTRTDGLCFHGRSLDVNYHNPDGVVS